MGGLTGSTKIYLYKLCFKEKTFTKQYVLDELEKQIEHLEGELIHQINNDSWVQNLKEKQIELEKIRDHKLQGVLIRSRWQLDKLGEKPSKFFLNLENKNFVSKHIRELKLGNKTINNPNNILEEMSNFYGHLYKKKNVEEISGTSFKNIDNKLKKLNDLDRSELEKDISIKELKEIVNNSKNNKSPGPDGFTNDFFKTFWPSLKIILLKLLNTYRQKKENK